MYNENCLNLPFGAAAGNVTFLKLSAALPIKQPKTMNLVSKLSDMAAKNGPEYLGSPAAVAELEHEGYFVGQPALRTIFHLAVKSKCVSRLIENGDWDGNAEVLIQRFVVHTGFQPSLVNDLIRTIAGALGYRVALPRDIVADDDAEAERGCEAAEPSENYCPKDEVSAEAWQAAYYNGENPRWRANVPQEEKRAFIDSIIETDREKEPMLGMTVRSLSCSKVGEQSLEITFEIVRTEPRATGALHYAVYDMRDRITDTGLAGALTVTDGSRLPQVLRIVAKPSFLKRIFFFWE